MLPAFLFIGVMIGVGLDNVIGEQYRIASVLFGGAIAAGLTWWSGRKLNDPERPVDNGEEVAPSRRHTLLFIPIQYYAILVFAFFVLFAYVFAGGSADWLKD